MTIWPVAGSIDVIVRVTSVPVQVGEFSFSITTAVLVPPLSEVELW